MHIPTLWGEQQKCCVQMSEDKKNQNMNINKWIKLINNLSIHFVWKEAE